jgi:hypothetical protein
MTGQEILDLIRAVKGIHVSWGMILSEHKGHQLKISVFRDAMKFDGVPAMTWTRKPVPETHPDHGKTYNGVRLPVTAVEMQQIADICGCMMLTPKVVDLIWLEAGKSGLQFESVVNVHGQIVAEADIHKVHEAIEAAIAKAGGDKGGILDSVGKYWVICNAMLAGKFTAQQKQAVNYGWPTRGQGNGPGVTGKVNVWQRIGSQHDVGHWDPSQTIRLMYRTAMLLKAGETEWTEVDLYDIATDPELADLISHEGPMKVTRQQGVPEPEGVQEEDGSWTLPEIIIFGDPKANLIA